MEKKANCIFLLGMPACGKTYWAKKLAGEFAVAMIDLDAIIETEQQMTITTIFENKGETYFRKLEHKTLKKIIQQTKVKTIISLGGGTPCFFDTISLLNKVGITIYLQAKPSTLLQNISQAPHQRPLLNDLDSALSKLSQLLKERIAIYEQAAFIFEVETLQVDSFKPFFEKP